MLLWCIVGMDAMQIAFGGAFCRLSYCCRSGAGPLISGRFFETSVVEWVILAALIGTVIIEMVLYFYTLRHAGPVFASYANFLAILTGFGVGRPAHPVTRPCSVSAR